MLFVELRFFLFFASVFALAWTLRGNAQRKGLLLVASYVFYAGWDWRFAGLIALSTGIDYVAALRMGGPRRRAWLVVSLVANLGILGVFKYFGFFVDSAIALADVFGAVLHRPALQVVLPVGISFFTFQSMSYTIDVYRGRMEARRSLLDVALFVAFFPQLVAGPIVRARDFLPQLEQRPRLADVPFRPLIGLFLIGLVKKVLFADTLGVWVDPYFADPAAFSPGSAWLAVPGFAAQIYCDFSGYTDMAIAIAGLLGYQLCENFRHPYLALDVRDFWRRWHISLSTWLRDYLYIQLGGGRGSRSDTARNLMITMGLGGLWHGAAWTFVVWGILHGAALILHREWTRWAGDRIVLPDAVAWGITAIWLCVTWIFFRALDMDDALTILGAFALGLGEGDKRLDPTLALGLVALLGIHWLAARGQLSARIERLPHPVFALSLGGVVAIVLWLYPGRFTPFIYFQF